MGSGKASGFRSLCDFSTPVRWIIRAELCCMPGEVKLQIGKCEHIGGAGGSDLDPRSPPSSLPP